MEIYRAHKVDLVQIYIQSVDPQIFKLIKVYEKNGILQIRPALEVINFFKIPIFLNKKHLGKKKFP